MLSPEDFKKFNIKVETIATSMLASMKSAVPYDSGELQKSLKLKTKYDGDMIVRATFSFARHGVFVESATGRGWKISEAGSGPRSAVPWYQPSVDAHLSNLEKAIDEHYEKAVGVEINIQGFKRGS